MAKFTMKKLVRVLRLWVLCTATTTPMLPQNPITQARPYDSLQVVIGFTILLSCLTWEQERVQEPWQQHIKIEPGGTNRGVYRELVINRK